MIDPVDAVDKPEKIEGPQEEEWEYVTGYKLFAVIGVVTLACFIMLLDTSIIATVGSDLAWDPNHLLKPTGHPQNHERLPLSQ